MRGENRVRNEDAEVREKEIRSTRVPLSGPRDVLEIYGKNPEYVYRIVNDVSNRVSRFKQAGWEIVTDEIEVAIPRVGTPSPTGSPVKIAVGGGIQAYVMKIHKAYFEEDQKAKHAKLLELEAAMESKTQQPGMYGKINKES